MEGLIALPQRLPRGALIWPQKPDLNVGCGHAATPDVFAVLFSRYGINLQTAPV
jgi:hypothetical protein